MPTLHKKLVNVILLFILPDVLDNNITIITDNELST